MSIPQTQFEAALDAVTHPADCQRICDLAQTRLSLRLTLGQAELVWRWHSEGLAASWLILGADDEIVRAISSFTTSRLAVRNDR